MRFLHSTLGLVVLTKDILGEGKCSLKFQAVDIGKAASAATLIFEALRKAIVEGDLVEGEALRQDEIARRFNASRIPVREALTMLEQQGLVKTERYKGAVVAGLSLGEADEIFEFRALVESEIIGRAVPKMTDRILQDARGYFEDFRNSKDPMAWGDLNRNFHWTLYSASELPFYLGVIDNAMNRIERYLRTQLVMSGENERANAEHLAILEACETGDAQRASELTRAHILGAKASLRLHMPQSGA